MVGEAKVTTEKGSPLSNSSSVLERMCHWEFEIGPIQIPPFQEK